MNDYVNWYFNFFFNKKKEMGISLLRVLKYSNILNFKCDASLIFMFGTILALKTTYSVNCSTIIFLKFFKW